MGTETPGHNLLPCSLLYRIPLEASWPTRVDWTWTTATLLIFLMDVSDTPNLVPGCTV